MVKQFQNDCVQSSFSIQILEIFERDGYVKSTMCPIAQGKRFERENH